MEVKLMGHFRVLVFLFQNESKGETLHMKMSSACSFIFMQIKVIFIKMALHLDSLWNRGTNELEMAYFSTDKSEILFISNKVRRLI